MDHAHNGKIGNLFSRTRSTEAVAEDGGNCGLFLFASSNHRSVNLWHRYSMELKPYGQGFRELGMGMGLILDCNSDQAAHA